LFGVLFCPTRTNRGHNKGEGGGENDGRMAKEKNISNYLNLAHIGVFAPSFYDKIRLHMYCIKKTTAQCVKIPMIRVNRLTR